MRWGVLFLVLGVLVAGLSGTVAASHAPATTVFQTEVGNAPAPFFPAHLDPAADQPLQQEEVVASFEIPPGFPTYSIVVTERRTETVRAEVLSSMSFETPSGERWAIDRYGAPGGSALAVCYPPLIPCTTTQTAADHNVPHEREPGTYKLIARGLTTGTYEITVFGFR